MKSIEAPPKTTNDPALQCMSEHTQESTDFYRHYDVIEGVLVSRPLIKRAFGKTTACSLFIASAMMRMCQRCELTEQKMARCGGCMRTYYCSRECQKADWEVHRGHCLEMQNLYPVLE